MLIGALIFYSYAQLWRRGVNLKKLAYVFQQLCKGFSFFLFSQWHLFLSLSNALSLSQKNLIPFFPFGRSISFYFSCSDWKFLEFQGFGKWLYLFVFCSSISFFQCLRISVFDWEPKALGEFWIFFWIEHWIRNAVCQTWLWEE